MELLGESSWLAGESDDLGLLDFQLADAAFDSPAASEEGHELASISNEDGATWLLTIKESNGPSALDDPVAVVADDSFVLQPGDDGPPAPSQTGWGRFTGPDPGENEDDYIMRVARELAPKVYLHSREEFFPSSVEHFLKHTYLDKGDGRRVDAERALLKEGYSGKGSLVTLEGLGCHSCYKPHFLKGQSLEEAPAYAIITKKGDVTDISYQFFYPFNYGKNFCIGAKLWGRCIGGKQLFGNHVGDWEHVTLRLVRGVPDSMYVGAHNFGGVVHEPQLRFEEGHPVVYSARGSHGSWATPGEHVYKKIFNGERLVDEADAGKAWRTWENLQIIKNGGAQREHPWLHFKGEWGNPASGCLPFSQKLGIPCVNTGGPAGPLRDDLLLPELR